MRGEPSKPGFHFGFGFQVSDFICSRLRNSDFRVRFRFVSIFRVWLARSCASQSPCRTTLTGPYASASKEASRDQ